MQNTQDSHQGKSGEPDTSRPKKRSWPRILILLGIAGFFAFRWWTLGDWFHAGAALLFGLAVLSSVVRLRHGATLLRTRQQTLILNVGISLVFLDLVFGQIEWEAMLTALAEANYWMLIPSMALVVASLFLRTWRWQWLLGPVGQVPFRPAFRATCIGIGANMVLPARAGEFLRAYAVGRSTGISKTAAFATLVVERIFDGLTILLSLLIVILLVGVRSPVLRGIGIVGGVFYFSALAAVSIFFFRQDWFFSIIQRMLPERWADPVLELMHAFAKGLEVLRDSQQLLVVSLQSLLIWFVLGLSFYPVMLAFDFGAQVPPFAPFLLLPLLALGLTIPGAPGGVGILQYMATLALSLSFAGIGAAVATDFAEQAAAFSLVLHFSQAAPEIALGAWAFLTEGLSWSEVEAGREVIGGAASR